MIAAPGSTVPHVRPMDMEFQLPDEGHVASSAADYVRDLETPKYGVERYMEEQLAAAGGRHVTGKDSKAGAVYKTGPYKGLSRLQAMEQIRKDYAALPDAQRLAYERGAQGSDVISGRERNMEDRHYGAKARAFGLDDMAPTSSPMTPARSTAPVREGDGGQPIGSFGHRVDRSLKMTDSVAKTAFDRAEREISSPATSSPVPAPGIRVRSFGEAAAPIDTPTLKSGGLRTGATSTSSSGSGLDFLRPRDEVQKRAIKPSATPLKSQRSKIQVRSL